MLNWHLNRRRFLRMSAGGAIAGAVLTPDMAEAQQGSAPEVLIIGAGMGGISTSYWLRQFGIRSLVLEGQARIGGRTWTSNRWPDALLDMGAAFVHDSPHSPLTPLVRRFNIRTVEVDFLNSTIYAPDGKQYGPTKLPQLAGLYLLMINQVKAAAALLQARGFPDRPLSTEIDRTLAQMRAQLGLTAEDIAGIQVFIDNGIRNHFCTETSDLSLYNFDQDSNVVGNHDLVFPRGYVQLVESLAAGQQILFNQVVREVRYGQQGVTVVTNQGTFTAKYAVITIPAGVMRTGNIRFVPALPEWKQAAYQRLHSGIFDKLFLRFPRAFWDATKFGFLRIPAQTSQYSIWFNAVPATNQPILAGIVFADFAAQLENMTDAQVVNQMMTVIRQWFGAQNIQVPNPVDFQRTRWGADPFALGSYPHLPPGASGLDYDILAQPVTYAANLPASANRLFFAGDSTHRAHVGSVWGAYESGIREAQRIQIQRTLR